jgi:opacity protein-like surface antigen
MSKHTILAATVALLLPALATAQSAGLDENRPAVVVFANGGGYSPLTDFNSSGSAALKTGWSLGGGAGVQINRFLAARAVFDYAQASGEAASTAFAGEQLKHYFYGADVQLRFPTAGGLAPYLLAGAGAVTIDRRNIPELSRFTKFAGKAGLGVEYSRPNGVGLFVQGVSYIYNFDRVGFDKTQADVLWNVGLSYKYSI